MRSDEASARIFTLLAPARTAFRSAVTAAVEELRTQMEAQRPANGRAALVAAELGTFAAGRIDASRFAELLDQRTVLDERAFALLDRSREVLAAIVAAGDAPFALHVTPGGDFAAELGAALAVAGRAFGAARVAELVRQGRATEAGREDAAGAFPFARWTRGERRLAPPLLIDIGGGDLQAGGLAAFLDGRQKLVLMVREPAPPAPLVRLVTPGVFVMQTAEAEDFERLAAFDGPAIGALVPDGCACFVHDPSAGATLAERLVVTHLPDDAPRNAIGRFGAFQQAQELALLRMLAEAAAPTVPVAVDEAPPVEAAVALAAVEPPPPVAGAPQAATAADGAAPADRLAAWLLQQADLTNIG